MTLTLPDTKGFNCVQKLIFEKNRKNVVTIKTSHRRTKLLKESLNRNIIGTEDIRIQHIKTKSSFFELKHCQNLISLADSEEKSPHKRIL